MVIILTYFSFTVTRPQNGLIVKVVQIDFGNAPQIVGEKPNKSDPSRVTEYKCMLQDFVTLRDRTLYSYWYSERNYIFQNGSGETEVRKNKIMCCRAKRE